MSFCRYKCKYLGGNNCCFTVLLYAGMLWDFFILQMRVRTRTPEVVVSVIQELIRRGGLRAALAGRDEKSLSIILKFLQK